MVKKTVGSFCGKYVDETQYGQLVYQMDGGERGFFRMENVKEDWLINIIIHTKSQSILLLQMEISDHLIWMR